MGRDERWPGTVVDYPPHAVLRSRKVACSATRHGGGGGIDLRASRCLSSSLPIDGVDKMQPYLSLVVFRIFTCTLLAEGAFWAAQCVRCI